MNSREKLLSQDVYEFIFNMLDNEVEFTGEDAGNIAASVQRHFESLLQE